MKILVACEESQRVCIAFRKKGHTAFSCDLQDCSGGYPEWHIMGDVLPLINGNCAFITNDDIPHYVDKWDMLIAFPPCTYLTPAGACNIPNHPEWIQYGYDAADFFMTLYSADCPRIAIENPPPMKRFKLPNYTQLIQPYMFGENNAKSIALWLKGLSPLLPTNIINPDIEIVAWINKKTGKRKSCSKWYNTNTHVHNVHRSKTFWGIAEAMADQWG